jgi:hypothetical protein
MFNQQELQVLLGGVNTPVDLNDLRQNTNYGGAYDEQEQTIVAFWNVSSGAVLLLMRPHPNCLIGYGELRH